MAPGVLRHDELERKSEQSAEIIQARGRWIDRKRARRKGQKTVLERENGENGAGHGGQGRTNANVLQECRNIKWLASGGHSAGHRTASFRVEDGQDISIDVRPSVLLGLGVS